MKIISRTTKIKINIDWISFTEKPNANKVTKVTNKGINITEPMEVTSRIRAIEPKEMTLQQFSKEIEQGKTYISGCIRDKSIKKLSADNTENFAFFGLDIDNIENQITIKDMIDKVFSTLQIYPSIAYETFSSNEEHLKFRLLYFFDEPIKEHSKFKDMYDKLKVIYPDCIDKSTSNANRLWYGTDKKVTIFDDIESVNFNTLMDKLNYLVPDIPQISTKKTLNSKATKIYDSNLRFNKSKSKELAKFIINSIDIVEFVRDFGGNVEEHRDYANCSCPFHSCSGKNKTTLRIYKNSNSLYCWSREDCVRGDIISSVMIYKSLDFFNACRFLVDAYGLEVPAELKRV